MMTRSYPSPLAFKQALEQRLRTATASGPEFARQRQLLVFDRFLARIAASLGDAVVLKGGLVLELRLQRARTTKDVDLRMSGSPDDLLGNLRSAARIDLADFMTFEISPDRQHPKIWNDGMQYEGIRFRVVCRLAGKPYGQPFGVDVAFGDPMSGEPELVTMQDKLGFAGIAPPSVRLYPVATHIAEKLHAYTMPRTRPNSRVKDLPDIALLASAGTLHADPLREALTRTFGFRDTHPPPTSLPPPHDAWQSPYQAMAADDGLPWSTLGDVFGAARMFLDPVLGGGVELIWDPASWSWHGRCDG